MAGSGNGSNLLNHSLKKRALAPWGKITTKMETVELLVIFYGANPDRGEDDGTDDKGGNITVPIPHEDNEEYAWAGTMKMETLPEDINGEGSNAIWWSKRRKAKLQHGGWKALHNVDKWNRPSNLPSKPDPDHQKFNQARDCASEGQLPTKIDPRSDSTEIVIHTQKQGWIREGEQRKYRPLKASTDAKRPLPAEVRIINC